MNEVNKTLGRVGLSLKGEYSNVQIYKRLDVAHDSMGSYISLQDNNVGHPLSDPAWWMPQSNSQPLLDAENKALVAAKKAEDAAAKAEGTDTGIANAEALRVTAETERANAENLRVASEKRRSDAEVLRKQDEDVRKTNETSRADAEKIRIAEEEKRVSAESTRAAEFARLKNESEAATRAAVTEAGKATQASTAANNAATKAENAATAANNAEKSVGQKITEADTAINDARTATQGANTAKDAATKAATDANAAKVSCDTAASNANTATGKANEAAANATTATGNMMKYVTEYNVSKLYPNKGIGGTDKYDLLTAIAALNADPTVDKSVGIKCSFTTSEGEPQTYKYNGPTFNSTSSWVLMEYLADTPSGDPMHWAYIESGAVYNATAQDVIKQAPWGEVIHKAGMWYLNGLGDITNREMNRIYSKSNKAVCVKEFASYFTPRERTNVCELNVNLGYSFENFAYSDNELVSVSTFKYGVHRFIVGYKQAFANCSRLKYIHTTLYSPDNVEGFKYTFKDCKSLQYIKIENLKTNVSFADSPLLDIQCVAYIINDAVANKPIVITLHAEAYARAMADASVQAALAAKTNISLASV